MSRPGVVVPSFLAMRETPRFSPGNATNNTGLREGEVVEVVYPQDAKNHSKKYLEYHVQVQHRANGTGTTMMYYNCQLLNPLGGLADRMYHTFRPRHGDGNQATKTFQVSDTGVGKGSKVLLLCVNGETNRAVIIGGVRDQADPGTAVFDKHAKDLQSLGHHLYGIFNGLSWYIDQDGQLSLICGGATEADGSRKASVPSSQVGSGFYMFKNGNISLTDQPSKNSFLIDHANSKVVIQRDKAFELGAATDYLLLGSSFRDAQKQLNNNLKTWFKSLQTTLQTAGQQLTTAAGSLIQDAAAAPGVVAAGAALVAAASMCQGIQQSIDAFEQQAQGKNSFLSQKNKAD